MTKLTILSRVRWRPWIRGFQVLITIILMGILAKSVDWSDLLQLFVNLNWQYIGLATVVLLISHLINVMRWRYVLQDATISYRKLLVFYGAGFFSNNFLPTGVGGDGVRAILLSREVSLSKALFSVGLDRVTGLLALPVFVVPGLWFGFSPGLKSILESVDNQGNLKKFAILLLIIFCGSLLIPFVWRQESLLHIKFRHFLARFLGFDTAKQLTHCQVFWLFSGAYGFSILSNSGTIYAHWIVLQALNVEVSFGVAIWLVLAGTAALVLPIAINGLGIMESTYVVLLTSYGVSVSTALGVALIIRMLILFYSLLGGLISLQLGSRTDINATQERSQA